MEIRLLIAARLDPPFISFAAIFAPSRLRGSLLFMLLRSGLENCFGCGRAEQGLRQAIRGPFV
jgi:hypothetical protein